MSTLNNILLTNFAYDIEFKNVEQEVKAVDLILVCGLKHLLLRK